MDPRQLESILHPLPPKIPTPPPAKPKKRESFAEYRARKLNMSREEYIAECVRYSCTNPPWASANYRQVYDRAAAAWDAAHPSGA